jgi:antitoxin component of RelBE/YafQ-DinJ toxin-antitoxin module
LASQLVTFRIPEDLYEEFKKKCARDGITVSKQLRRFVDDFLYPITRLEPTKEMPRDSDRAIDTSSQDDVYHNTLAERLHQLRRAIMMLNKRLYTVEKHAFEPSQAVKLAVDITELRGKLDAGAKEVDKLCGGH